MVSVYRLIGITRFTLVQASSQRGITNKILNETHTQSSHTRHRTIVHGLQDLSFDEIFDATATNCSVFFNFFGYYPSMLYGVRLHVVTLQPAEHTLSMHVPCFHRCLLTSCAERPPAELYTRTQQTIWLPWHCEGADLTGRGPFKN